MSIKDCNIDNRAGTKSPEPAGSITSSDDSPVGGGNGSLGRLFWEFLKLGLFTIGGGMAMIPQMQRIAVEDNGWLTREEVIDCIAVSQSLPGIVAINMATYIGRKMAGFRGALCATLGVALPSFVIIILAVLLLDNVDKNPWIDGAFTGVKAAVCGLLIVTAITLGRQVIRTHVQLLMMVAAMLAVAFGGVNAILVIIGAALLGIVYTCAGSTKLDDPEAEDDGNHIDDAGADHADGSIHADGPDGGEVDR